MPVQRKVTKEIAAAMFKLYQQETPLAELVRTFGISEPTITRIKKRDRWDERIDEIRRKAQAVADNKSVYTLANQLIEVNAFINGVVSAIAHEAKHPRPCPNCSATGKVANSNCDACSGTGKVKGIRGDLKDYRELVKTKIELLDLVTPEIPKDAPSPQQDSAPQVDRVASILERLEKAAKINLEELGDRIAIDITKQRGGDQPK